MSDSFLETTMDRFFNRENIKRYRNLASASTDATERLRIVRLLAEEEAQFRLELRRRGDVPKGRSTVNAIAAIRVEHGGEENGEGIRI
jgi:hypothetical protein